MELPHEIKNGCQGHLKDITKVIREDVDYEQEYKGKPLCFKSAHEFTVTLPHNINQGSDNVNPALVERITRSELESAGIISSRKGPAQLHPLKPIGSGRDPIDVISMVMWGVVDKQLFLRGLLLLAITNTILGSFKRRFFYNRFNGVSSCINKNLIEDVDAVWKRVDEYMRGDNSSALGDTSFTSFCLFVLSNVVKRPIIVTSTGHTGGKSLAGIYLPLERNNSECCKTPIFVGSYKGLLYPLVYGKGGINVIPVDALMGTASGYVRFMLPQEESLANLLVYQYLDVISDVSGNICVKFDNKSLPEQWTPKNNGLIDVGFEANSSNEEYRQKKSNEETNLLGRGGKRTDQQIISTNAWKQNTCNNSHYTNNIADPEKQTTCVSNQRTSTEITWGFEDFTRENDSVLAPPHEICSPHLDTDKTYMEIERSDLRPPPEMNMFFNKPRPDEVGAKRCVTRTCTMFGSPETGGLCSVCFNDYTIRLSRPNHPHGNEMSDLVSIQRHAEMRFKLPMTSTTNRQAEPKSRTPMTSMMNVNCRNNCGFNCSVYSYPYCHECAPSDETLLIRI